MRTPDFWFTPPNNLAWQARILHPLGRIYAMITAMRMRKTGTRVTVPVICVGNLNAGGTGKTPTVIALVKHLGARGIRPHIVSRGHGGKLRGPIRVDPNHHTAHDVGDEPLLLAQATGIPVWVSRKRDDGAIMATGAGAQAIILDDGFQNPSLEKSLSIIVVDAARGFGNGLCLPAGPLREPVQDGLARAELVLGIGSDAAQERFIKTWGGDIQIPYMHAELRPTDTASWSGRRVLAFAGIGHPEKFFDTLRATGAEVVDTASFADHAPFTDDQLADLKQRAVAMDAILATTEKDFMRLPPEMRPKVMALPVELIFENPAPLDAELDRIGC